MPVKKTTKKETTVKKTVSKPVNKTVEKEETITKPHVVVETKKVDVCNCGDSCSCGDGRSCGWFLKPFILLLVLANLILTICVYCRNETKWAWAIETMKDGGKENMEKVIQLYESDYYKSAQKSSIESYASQLAADSQAAAE